MNSKNFVEMFDAMCEDEKNILISKGKEYRCGQEDDVLANFKRNAQLMGMSPSQVWAIYFMKHIDAILNFVRDGKTHSSESIDSRVFDARNYLALGLALFRDMCGPKIPQRIASSNVHHLELSPLTAESPAWINQLPDLK